MSRRKLIAGNWKMYTSAVSAKELALAVVDGLGGRTDIDVALFPPYPWLGIVAAAVAGSNVIVGAQNVSFANEGAYTGEVSPTMLKEVGCTYSLVGHSERRHGLGETDDLLNRKTKAALAAGLKVIFCIGETLADREAGRTEAILDRQLTAGLLGLSSADAEMLVVAYEPVWAIGTGKVATTSQAQEAHAFVRHRFGELLGAPAAAKLTIQYGGSVKPDNAAELMAQPDIDGALVGGASLKADSFLAIVRASAI